MATTTAGSTSGLPAVMNNVAVISKQPDLITDMKDTHHRVQPQHHNQLPHGGSAGSASQVSSQGSYKMAMENIIVDYR